MVSLTGLAALAVLGSLTAVGPADADQGMQTFGGFGGRGSYESYGQNFGYAGNPYGVAPSFYGQPGYYGTPLPSATGQVPGYQYFSPSLTGDAYGSVRSQSRGVTINVSVPADAEIWFNGTKTSQTGTSRRFESPPLPDNHEYSYQLKVRWNRDGKDVTQERRVPVHAGDVVNLSFNPAR